MTSVTCLWSLVRFQMSQVSTVPKTKRPALAAADTAGMWSNSQRSCKEHYKLERDIDIFLKKIVSVNFEENNVNNF